MGACVESRCYVVAREVPWGMVESAAYAAEFELETRSAQSSRLSILGQSTKICRGDFVRVIDGPLKGRGGLVVYASIHFASVHFASDGKIRVLEQLQLAVGQ